MKNPYTTDELIEYLQFFWAKAEGLEYGHEHEVMRCAAAKLQELSAYRLKLERRIHNQRVALRENWQTTEMRASWKRAWYPSKLLTAILHRSRIGANGQSAAKEGNNV